MDLHVDFACYPFHRILEMAGLLHDAIVVVLRALCNECGGLGHQTCEEESAASDDTGRKYMPTK